MDGALPSVDAYDFNFLLAPTMVLTQLSPDIFTTVRHISKGRSTANINVNAIGSCSDGNPTDSRTMTNITIPALGAAAAPVVVDS